jgi:hypothetical protein
VRQVFITTRTLPFFSAENIALHLLLEDRATQECKLKAVRGSAWFGVAPLLVRPRQVPPPMIVRASGARGVACSGLARFARDTNDEAHAGWRRHDPWQPTSTTGCNGAKVYARTTASRTWMAVLRIATSKSARASG